MLYEYAVDPTVTGREIAELQHLFALFGLDRGRYMSLIDKESWFSEAYKASAGKGDVARKRIEVLLRRVMASKAYASGRVPDSSLDWIGNTRASHAARPFQAIVSDKTDPTVPAIIEVADVDELHPLFRCEQTRRVERTENALASALLPMALIGKRLALIDPFLDLRNIRGQDFRSVIARLLSDLAASGRANVELELHWRSHDSRPPEALVKQNARTWCAGMIPRGYRLVFYEWIERPRGEDFHDRFFLTEAGGIAAGAGFEVIGAHEKVQLSLLTPSNAQSHLDDIDLNNGAFDLAFRPVVVESDGTTSSL